MPPAHQNLYEVVLVLELICELSISFVSSITLAWFQGQKIRIWKIIVLACYS